jgi:hypothetical protein
MEPRRTTLWGVALVCFANLLLSIVVTRLFSATMFYHFTFMAVGLAMFGIAASGVFVFLNRESFATDIQRHLARHARWFALATLTSLLYTVSNPIFGSNGVPEWSSRVFWQLVLLIVFTALPFFFAGVVVSLAMTFFRNHVNRVYFFDLVGAALAALVAGVILGVLGGPTAVLFAAAIALVAAALFEHGVKGRARWIAPALAVAFVGFNAYVPTIRLGPAKWETRLRFEKWNAFSRITVDAQRHIMIDAGASTEIVDARTLKPGMAKNEITALALQTWATPPEQVLIIGPGGGRDVMFALSAGATKVIGVEINPLIANDIMQHSKFAERSGHLYADPRVEIVVDEGRSYVSRTKNRFDFIQASLVDTWAATAAGAFALTENTLYTVEAFEDYYAHLTDRGVVTMTRFYAARGPGLSEGYRLVILAAGALEATGVAPRDVRRHMFFVTSPQELGTLIVKKTPFLPDEIERLNAASAAAGFTPILSPRSDGSTLLERYIDGGVWGPLVREASDELRPPTDDRPFFFYFTKFGDLFSVTDKQIYDPSLWVLLSLGTVLVLGVLFIVLPIVVALLRGQAAAPGESRRAQTTVLSYFGLVGFAFMAIEIALLQRFTLFLGHPTYSLLVILFVVLLSTAIGARLSERFPRERLGKVMLVGALALAVLAGIYALVLGDVLRALIGLARPLRIVITALLVTPCGLLMGVMVPSIVRLLAAAKSPLVPWGWGINGATSVIGTSVATIVAMYAGFAATFVVGAVAYAAAGGLGVLAARAYRRPS